MILTYEQFLQYYDKYGRCVNQINKPKKYLNEKQLWSIYKRYLRSEDKKQKLIQVKKEVSKRDYYSCRLKAILDDNLKLILKEKAGKLVYILDHAHIFSKGSHSRLQYDKKNIVLLNRYSHTMLDSQKHPIYGWIISVEEKENWWKKILGEDSYNTLKEKI